MAVQRQPAPEFSVRDPYKPIFNKRHAEHTMVLGGICKNENKL